MQIDIKVRLKLNRPDIQLGSKSRKDHNFKSFWFSKFSLPRASWCLYPYWSVISNILLLSCFSITMHIKFISNKIKLTKSSSLLDPCEMLNLVELLSHTLPWFVEMMQGASLKRNSSLNKNLSKIEKWKTQRPAAISVPEGTTSETPNLLDLNKPLSTPNIKIFTYFIKFW